jgi:hypothetical protein
LRRCSLSFNIFLVIRCVLGFFKLMVCLRTLLRIYEKKSNPKKLKNKKSFGCPSYPKNKRVLFWGHNS